MLQLWQFSNIFISIILIVIFFPLLCYLTSSLKIKSFYLNRENRMFKSGLHQLQPVVKPMNFAICLSFAKGGGTGVPVFELSKFHILRNNNTSSYQNIPTSLNCYITIGSLFGDFLNFGRISRKITCWAHFSSYILMTSSEIQAL